MKHIEPIETNIEEIGIEVSPAAYRITNNAISTGRTSFADLDILVAEDSATQTRLYDIRTELESLAALPYTSELGLRFMDLTESWLDLDPHGLLAYLDDPTKYEVQQ